MTDRTESADGFGDLLEALVRTQEAIAEAAPDVDRVVDLVAEQARILTEADGAVVELVEDDEMVYRAAAGSAAPFVGLRLDVHASLSGRAVLQNEILVCHDAETDERVDREAARKVGARSMILVPLVTDGRAVGVLKVLSARPSAFDARDVELLRLMAGLMSASITRAAEARERDVLGRRLRAIVDASPDAIWAVDRNGRVTLWSPAAESLYGWSSEEVAGREPPVVHPEHADAHRGLVERVMAGEEVRDLETRHADRDGGTVDVRVAGVPRRDADGEVAGGVFFATDVRERNRMMEEVLKARKFETIARLAGGIAHDFNNMLTAIQGFARVLLEEGLTSDQEAHVLEILRASRRSSYITDQLLAYSRQQVMEVQVLDPVRLVRSVQLSLGHVVGDRLHLDVRLPEKSWYVEADRGQLEQVLLNLVANAREAVPVGEGGVTVSVENTVLGAEEAERLRLPAGDYVELRVGDTGRGIAPEEMERIFEPFYTTKDMAEGTGLGLAMVEGIVRQSSGAVGVESEPGRGSTFRIFLPRVEAEPSAHPEDRGEASGGPFTVLVVEDEPAVLRLVRKVLERKGHRVVAADGPTAALEEARRHAGEIDVVVTDVVMPEMHGDRLAEALRPILPTAPVLFVSGYTRDELPRLEESGRRSAFLGKPFTPVELLDALQELVTGT